jgi:dUTP pyrophosphatase
MEKIIIKRIDKDLPLPRYETRGSVAFDLLTRVETVVPAGRIALIPSNIIVKIPEGYMLALASRSSTPLKKGLSTPHGIGVIDTDYHGPEDELKVQVYNFTENDITVGRGDRVAQGIFIPVSKFEFEEVEQIDAPSRGGFGSTN